MSNSDDKPRDRSYSRSRPPRGGGGGGGGGGNNGRKTGIAQRWNDKGFGKPDDGSEDVFCHFSAIKDGKCLVQGSPVEYETAWDDRKGKDRAENVTGGAPEDRDGGMGGGGGYGGGPPMGGGGYGGGGPYGGGGGGQYGGGGDQYGGGGGGQYGGGGGGQYGGGGGGGPPPGGYETRPGDWECPSCRANVFASKSSCFKCGESKPGGGGGGGGGGRY
ncbi:hypothetical protein M885DRAFT_563809 [Pelagophyceae sp. CCMP2097]|nr:hypothetical protein M885DRAFT_563809 [Pelagophyceae sp. CCMP2097]